MNLIRSNNAIVETTDPHYWSEVFCHADCPNAGPWVIFGPAKEEYFCSKCGSRMGSLRLPQCPRS